MAVEDMAAGIWDAPGAEAIVTSVASSYSDHFLLYISFILEKTKNHDTYMYTCVYDLCFCRMSMSMCMCGDR